MRDIPIFAGVAWRTSRVRANSGTMPETAARSIDDCLAPVMALAIERLRPERIILFGSQARGDADKGSDIDLAIDAPGVGEGAWSRFVLDAGEALDCLKGLDLVRLDQAATSFRQRIEKEGRVLYPNEDHAEAS